MTAFNAASTIRGPSEVHMPARFDRVAAWTLVVSLTFVLSPGAFVLQGHAGDVARPVLAHVAVGTRSGQGGGNLSAVRWPGTVLER